MNNNYTQCPTHDIYYHGPVCPVCRLEERVLEAAKTIEALTGIGAGTANMATYPTTIGLFRIAGDLRQSAVWSHEEEE